MHRSLSLYKWVFSSFLNWPTVVSDWCSEAGRLFQSLGPVSWKAWSPKPVWVRGTTQVETSDERSQRRPTSETTSVSINNMKRVAKQKWRGWGSNLTASPCPNLYTTMLHKSDYTTTKVTRVWDRILTQSPVALAPSSASPVAVSLSAYKAIRQPSCQCHNKPKVRKIT